MRLRLGRPDIGRYADRFTLATADNDASLSVTWLGVSTLLVDDVTSALLTDGFFSRPGMLGVALLPLRSASSRIDDALNSAGISRVEAVLPVHTHYDHALDSAEVARRTGAVVVGGESAANIARGHGLPEERIVVTRSGSRLEFGHFDVTLIESEHCPPDRFPGPIREPVAPSARASAYRCGEAWSTMIRHRTSGRRLLIQGSAGFVPGALNGQIAEIAYLGVGQLGLQPTGYIERYWDETVRAVGARQVVLIHWDDFFRPLTAPLRALPYAADDLDATMTVFDRLAARDGVAVHLPTLWQHADPWV